MDERTFLIIALVLCIGFIIFFMSRSRENYGMLRPSERATARFQSNSQSSHLDYYYCGPESNPLAIIGVEKKFRFDSVRHLVKVKPEEDSLEQLIAGMQSKAGQLNQNLRGFEIVDQRGECVGEWYSAIGIQAVVKRTGIDSVEVWPPAPAKPEP